MTLLLLDGFEDDLSDKGKYADFNRNNTWTGRTGYGFADANSHSYQLRPADESDTLIVGFGFFWDGGDTRDLLHFYSDGGSTLHGRLRNRSSGQIDVLYGTTTTTTVIANPLHPFTWYYAELKMKLSDTVGTVQLKIDGTTVMNLSGVDTKNGGTKTTYDRVLLNASQTARVDDYYLCNNAGAVNNDFLGDLVVETLLPSGNGNSSVLVGSDGNSVNNYLLVNETNPDTSSYVGSATSGDKDTYTFADLTHTSGTVLGVQIGTYAAKSDSGSRTFRPVTRSGGTDYPGSDLQLSTTYTTFLEMHETDPATSAAWSISGVNAAEFGFEVRP